MDDTLTTTPVSENTTSELATDGATSLGQGESATPLNTQNNGADVISNEIKSEGGELEPEPKVEVTTPVAVPESAPMPAPESVPAMITESAPVAANKGATVLVAEDDDFLSRVLIDKLEKEHFQVITAVDGEDAIAKAISNNPQVIILDIIMPKKTGFDVIDALKANPATQNTPILILSNLGQEADVKRAMEKGVKDYFVKANISLVSVVEKIRQYLGA